MDSGTKERMTKDERGIRTTVYNLLRLYEEEYDRFTEDERQAITKVRFALNEIADGDR